MVKKGQFATSRQNLSKQTGISEQSLRTAIRILSEVGFLTSESTSQFTIISIGKYGHYQDKPTSKSTSHQPAINQPSTSDPKNPMISYSSTFGMKKEKKGEKGEAGQEPTHSGPSLGEVRTYIQEKGLSVDPVIFFNHYEAKGWAGIKSWKALLEKWEAQDAKKREEKESPQYREAKENRRRELEEANHD